MNDSKRTTHPKMQKKNRFMRLTLLLSLVALVISLVFNVLLFVQARYHYLLLNSTNLDPLGLHAFSTDSDVPVASTTTVVFFGDSRAAQWPAPKQFKDFYFVNRGIINQTSVQVLGRFDKHVLPLQPDIIILQIGINDLKTIPLFPERKAAIIVNCKSNIQQLVTRSVNSGATVILTTIFPIGPVPLTRQPFWSPEIAQAVSEVNAYLNSLKASNVLILDTYSLLADNGKVRSNYVRDTLHIDRKGYEAINQELTKVLSNWLKEKSIHRKS